MPPRALPRVLSRGSMNQDTMFYTTQWTREVDDLFILGLCEQTGIGNYIVRGNANRKAINYVKDRVNGHYGSHFEYKFCLDRFRRLYKRYTIFKYIIEQSGVVYDESTHKVIVGENVWNRICRGHALACAYMRRGEGQYHNLTFIFTAIPEVPGGGGEIVEVIQILSDHETVSGTVGDGGVFETDLAWYTSGNRQGTSLLSTNVQDTGSSRNRREKPAPERAFRRHSPNSGSGPSSQASSSPYNP